MTLQKMGTLGFFEEQW